MTDTGHSRCVVLVPANGPLDTGCEPPLRELEERGYEVRRIGGYGAIEQAGNQMASHRPHRSRATSLAL